MNRNATGLRSGLSQPVSPDVQLDTVIPKRPSSPTIPGNGCGASVGGWSRIFEQPAATNASRNAAITMPTRCRISAPRRPLAGECLERFEGGWIGQRVLRRRVLRWRAKEDSLDGHLQ